MVTFYDIVVVWKLHVIMFRIFCLSINSKINEINQLHAVSRTRQGIPEALRVEWQNLTPRFASTPERRNGNINLNKYFISSSGD